MEKDMNAPFKRTNRKLVHQGKLLSFYEDTLEVPNGNIAIYDFLAHKGAAAVVPVCDDGKILMVRQFRNAIDRYTWEIPAGGLNGADEPTKDAAARELEEECGYFSNNLEILLSIYTTVALCNEKIDIYVAHDLKESKQHLDEDEYIVVKAFEIDELLEMIYRLEIQDSKTVAALLAYKNKYKN